MKSLEEYNHPVLEYELIDYSKPSRPSPPYKPDIHKLMEWEAHEKNKGLALNGTTLRYVRV